MPIGNIVPNQPTAVTPDYPLPDPLPTQRTGPGPGLEVRAEDLLSVLLDVTNAAGVSNTRWAYHNVTASGASTLSIYKALTVIRITSTGDTTVNLTVDGDQAVLGGLVLVVNETASGTVVTVGGYSLTFRQSMLLSIHSITTLVQLGIFRQDSAAMEELTLPTFGLYNTNTSLTPGTTGCSLSSHVAVFQDTMTDHRTLTLNAPTTPYNASAATNIRVTNESGVFSVLVMEGANLRGTVTPGETEAYTFSPSTPAWFRTERSGPS